MKIYEDETMLYTTAEVAQFNSIKVDDPNIITKLFLLGFDGCEIRGDYYFLGTPRLLNVLELIKKN